MLRIDRQTKALKRLDKRRLPEAGLMERYDLQQMIRNSPEEFFAEMGETLLLVAEEVRPAEFVDDRIDLLAVDPQGAVVIIELKRGANKLQLLQALSYAAMISRWDRSRLTSERAALSSKSIEEAEDEVQQFVGIGTGDLNLVQRIMLLAEDFEYEVLVTAEWLTEQYEMDIRCYRLTLSADGEAEYLTCTGIYPAPEITDHAVRRGRSRGAKPAEYADWDAALSEVDKPIIEFFRRELAASQWSYLPKRLLSYRIQGKRRLDVSARRKTAYVWQWGRFKDDLSFWANRLSAPDSVVPVKNGENLRFFLATEDDFSRFSRAVHQELQDMSFDTGPQMDGGTVLA